METYHQPDAILPVTPHSEVRLSESAARLIAQSSRLSSLLSPPLIPPIRALIESMNGYYSNLIEGQITLPNDIEGAIQGNYSTDVKRKNLQLLHIAHLSTERWMRAEMDRYPLLEPSDPDFILNLHKKFYEKLPEEMRVNFSTRGKRFEIEPGRLRDYPVTVGAHNGVAHEKLNDFMEFFSKQYRGRFTLSESGIIAAFSSHHRLTFIHPFGDGNGRVSRLYTTACLMRCGVDSGGLWSFSRAMARNENGIHYKRMLQSTDSQRLDDLDGRNNLSEKRLKEWAGYCLNEAIDQCVFMGELLSLDLLKTRVSGYLSFLEHSGMVEKGSASIIKRVLEKGTISRGEASKETGFSSRYTQNITGKLLSLGILSSPSPKGDLFFAIPGFAAPYYFPKLYPMGEVPSETIPRPTRDTL